MAVALTCINSVVLWSNVSTYLTNQASCGALDAVFTPTQLIVYNLSIANGGTAASGVVATSVLPALSLSGGTQIAVSIAMLWGLAFVIRVLCTIFKSERSDNE